MAINNPVDKMETQRGCDPCGKNTKHEIRYDKKNESGHHVMNVRKCLDCKTETPQLTKQLDWRALKRKSMVK